MSKNKNLQRARDTKYDEYYTMYEDIEQEVSHYWDALKGKRVLCPCDDYRHSNFVRYFVDNYDQIGLAGLTATCYDTGDGAWKWTYDGREGVAARLDGDGDFRSDEITALKDGWADIVVTNPPFSLWREFLDWLYD